MAAPLDAPDEGRGATTAARGHPHHAIRRRSRTRRPGSGPRLTVLAPTGARSQADLNEVAYDHGHRGRDILWSNGSPLQRGIPLAESHQPSCKPLIAKGTDTDRKSTRLNSSHAKISYAVFCLD